MKLNLAVCSLMLCLARQLPVASANLRHGLKGARPSAETDNSNIHAGKAHRSLKKEEQAPTEGAGGREVADNKKNKEKSESTSEEEEAEDVNFSEETDETGVGGREVEVNNKKGKKNKGKQVTETEAPATGREEVVTVSNATAPTDREDVVDTNNTIALGFDDNEELEEDFQFGDPPAWDRIDEFLSSNIIDVESSNTTASSVIVGDELVVDREDTELSNVVLSDLYDASKAGSSRQEAIPDSSESILVKIPIPLPQETDTETDFSENATFPELNATFPEFTEPALVEEPGMNDETITGDKIAIPLKSQSVVQTADIVEDSSLSELELRLTEVEIQMNTITTMAASIEKLELELEKVMQILNIHGGAITTLADRTTANQAPTHITGFDSTSEP